MGNILSLDWGRKKVGYATSDPMGIAITPRDRFYRNPKLKKTWELQTEDIRTVQKIIEEFESEVIILGLPLNVDGTESEASENARRLAKSLEDKFSLPVLLINESLSSWNSRCSDNIDADAAATLIRDYFEQKKRNYE